MKFIVLYMLFSNLPLDIKTGVYPGLEFQSRETCEATSAEFASSLDRASQGLVWVEDHVCIQIGGPVRKFPVRERIAEGWERA